MRVRKCRRQPTSYIRVWDILIHSSLLEPGLSPFHLFYRKDFIKFSLKLGKAWPWFYFWDSYYHMAWWIRRFRNLDSVKHQLCRTWWKCILSTSRSSRDTRNQSRSNIPLGVQTRWRVHRSLRGLTCAIYVFA